MTQIKGHLINLVRGWPNPSLLPTQLLSASAQTVLADPSIYSTALQYGDDPGYQPLREAMATWLHEHYKVERDPERICISGGASQNIACILQSYTDPNVTRAVWIAAPTYHLVCDIFSDAGFSGRLKAFPEDEEGPNIESLESRLRTFDEGRLGTKAPVKDHGPYRKFYRHIIYVVPTCANPSGKTMPVKRRKDLVQLARRHDALIICDDVYDFLQWPVCHDTVLSRVESDALPEMILPRLCDIDLEMEISPNDENGFGYAVSNGSFSKLVGPGMRTGWLEGSRAFVFGLAQTGSTKSGGSPSQFSAAVIADMLASRALQNHLATVVRPALHRRHHIFVQSIQQYLVPLGINLRWTGLVGCSIYGGYFVWLTLPEHLSADTVAGACIEESLIVASGTIFQVKGDSETVDLNAFLRLTFAYVPEEDLVQGVIRLMNVIQKLLEKEIRYS
ncbi:hypothetical protein S7711_09722 [Stachybotrys chartarum IBT 7711]|uniref:Aminotransferase class I/classII large domain-containing protein n=1 Tax=Stachybotrys chartarum (strain CBS 109288 / IBT 7711) TaxID=1280523 RepID=A0A084AN23_STACB|nr:hypothetical protein S7711_09722 [Stachybotrys chartarum IBT 7711]